MIGAELVHCIVKPVWKIILISRYSQNMYHAFFFYPSLWLLLSYLVDLPKTNRLWCTFSSCAAREKISDWNSARSLLQRSSYFWSSQRYPNACPSFPVERNKENFLQCTSVKFFCVELQAGSLNAFLFFLPTPAELPTVLKQWCARNNKEPGWYKMLHSGQ